MEIRKVGTRKELRSFIDLPRRLYRNDPYWVPPLWKEERSEYGRGKNVILSHSDYILFIALHEGRVAGRAVAYVDHNFNNFYRSSIGFFGSFECIDNFDLARALLTRVEDWLQDQGMSSVRGPINPVAESWGFLYSGFDSSPIYLSPYNPSYYNSFLPRIGYQKIKDLLAYEANARDQYRIPARITRFSETLLRRRPQFTVRRINLKQLHSEAEHIWRITNIAVSNNWGYVPLDRRELHDLVAKLRPIADADAIWFVEDSDVPVGCCLGFPDINILLKKIKGRLFPFGFFRFLTGLRKIKDYRLWALSVLPEYHGLGLDVLLYKSLYEALAPKNIRLEANYILEDNANIRNALEKLNMELIKTYRVYEKTLD